MKDILKKIFVSSLLLFSTNAFAEADLLSPDGMTQVMAGVDDGTVHINLGHAFPYMGGVFTDAWMSSNGFLMFYDPTKGFGNSSTWNNGCCSGYNPSGQGMFSYMLAPLWTDLRDPDGSGEAGYYYKTDEGHSSFLWYNVVEFGTSNTNTFQVELYSGGSFDFIYDEVDITQHSVWIGFTGDTSKTDSTGKYVEVNELMYAQGGMTEFDIDFHSETLYGGRAWYGDDAGYGAIDTGPDCSNPLNDTSCEGYEEAYYDQQCSADALYDSMCPGYEQAYFDQQCGLDALYDSGCPGYAEAFFTQQCTLDPLYANECPGYDDAYFAQQCTYNQQYDILCPGYIEPMEEPVYIVEDLSSQTTQNSDFLNPEPEIFEEETIYEEPVETFEEFVYEEVDMYTEPEEFDTTEELVANDGSVNEEQVLAEAISEEIEEEIAVLEELEVVDVLEEDILEEESKPESKIDAISLILEQTSELVSSLESKSVNNDTSDSSNASFNSNFTQNEEDSSTQNAQEQKNVSYGQNMAQESGMQIEMSGQDTDFTSSDSGFYGTDNNLYAVMTGSASNDAENVSKNEQKEQNVQDTKQSLALGDSAPIGFAIIPVQTANGIIETVVPVEEQSLAERLAEQVRQRNLENSNEAAVGQTAQVQRIASATDMSDYYAQSYSSSNDLYTQEQVYGGVTINDNNRSHYNMFSNSHGKMYKLIRSQYDD